MEPEYLPSLLDKTVFIKFYYKRQIGGRTWSSSWEGSINYQKLAFIWVGKVAATNSSTASFFSQAFGQVAISNFIFNDDNEKRWNGVVKNMHKIFHKKYKNYCLTNLTGSGVKIPIMIELKFLNFAIIKVYSEVSQNNMKFMRPRKFNLTTEINFAKKRNKSFF